MPLSVDGYRIVSSVAASMGIDFVALRHPHADLRYASAVAEEAGIPSSALRTFDSAELESRQLMLHAPSLLVFANGRFSGTAVPGFRDAERYRAVIEERLSHGSPEGLRYAQPQPASDARPAPAAAPYCAVQTPGAKVEVVRPQPNDASPGIPVIDDVNWFARPVPNPRGHWIVAFASHNLNYLYNLTTGARIRIPDKSDGVATPDGRYMTVPSHYTSTATVNFYDLPTLLERLDGNKDAADVPPVFAHKHADVADAYYQSVGVVSSQRSGDDETTVYRMMFSGARHPQPPGFRIVDYRFQRTAGKLTVTPSEPMRLCPEIVRDMATPFISKDGRYVVAHDQSRADVPASLKIFEIMGTDPAAGTTRCEQRVDFGFAAGKADFSFDGSQLTFHISKHDYLTVFVDGGIKKPAITDVAVVDLVRTPGGEIVGHRGMSRVTTSQTEGVGNYFPAFMPDGKLFYISNQVPKDSSDPKRFRFFVVDPSRQERSTNVFLDERRRGLADTIGKLWRTSCAPELQEFKPGEAPWTFLSLSPQQCRALVNDRWTGTDPSKADLLAACDASTSPTSR
jgi:hypothetical protein